MDSTFAPKRDLGFSRYCWMGFSASCTVLFLPTSLRLSYSISLSTAYVLCLHAGKAACIETRYTLAMVVAVHRSVSCKPLVSAEYNTKCTSFAMMQQCRRPQNTRTGLDLEAPLVVEHAISRSILAALYFSRIAECNPGPPRTRNLDMFTS